MRRGPNGIDRSGVNDEFVAYSLNSTEAVSLVTSSRGCYAENGPVEFKLIACRR